MAKTASSEGGSCGGCGCLQGFSQPVREFFLEKGLLICFLFARVGAGRTPANTRITRSFDPLYRPTSDLVVAVIGGAIEAEAAFYAPGKPTGKLGELEAAEAAALDSWNGHLMATAEATSAVAALITSLMVTIRAPKCSDEDKEIFFHLEAFEMVRMLARCLNDPILYFTS